MDGEITAVLPAAPEVDLFAVPAQITEALVALRTNQDRLTAAMKAFGNKFNANHARSASQMATALKTLSSEARQWADMLKQSAVNASQEERTAACVRYIGSLPVAYRAAAYTALAAAEAAGTTPLPLQYTPQ